MKADRKRTLLRYWTTRYLATLFIGLLVIAIISVFWIRNTTLENRLNITKFLAEEIADRFVYNDSGQEIHRRGVPGIVEDRQQFLDLDTKPSIYIVDTNGIVLATNLPAQRSQSQPLSLTILQSEKEIYKLKLLNRMNYYVVKTPIQSDEIVLGWVVIVQTEQDLTMVNQEYRLLGVMLVSLAVLGWIAIYFLSRKLSRPIQHVSDAAKKIQDGNYDIHLPQDPREKEVYDLVSSFKNMASRLQHLESLRAELLAGVTHELKTPVTSISGLLQAVRDDVVTGDDAKEFLDISLKETGRMQKMVGDLLEFNTFSVNAVPLSNERYVINDLLKEITYQWNIVQDNEFITLDFSLPNQKYEVYIDSMRLQQILVNLLNNAKQSIEGTGTITVNVIEAQNGQLAIDIKDTGSGIPKEEHGLIFERFYRGENKKFKVRGLGLGLSFSKMLANSMGGDLVLKESSPDGTTFTLLLPYINPR